MLILFVEIDFNNVHFNKSQFLDKRYKQIVVRRDIHKIQQDKISLNSNIKFSKI